MPGIATGEVFAFPEGKLYLYASASGATSGSGIAFARESNLTMTYGWDEQYCADGTWNRVLTGQRVDLTIAHLLSDRSTYNLANGTGAINAKFEGLITGGGIGQSAYWTLYSGVIDSCALRQADNEMFTCSLVCHANDWSAVGG